MNYDLLLFPLSSMSFPESDCHMLGNPTFAEIRFRGIFCLVSRDPPPFFFWWHLDVALWGESLPLTVGSLSGPSQIFKHQQEPESHGYVQMQDILPLASEPFREPVTSLPSGPSILINSE